MPTIKGTASVVDDHAMAKQLKQTKFPEIFSKKVDMKKVNVAVVSQWVEKEIAELLGMEDEIVASTAINLFLEPQEATDPRRAQLNLVGFLTEEKAAIFAESLWTLLLDAQDQNSGIPRKLLEEKKAELQKQKEEERKNQAAQRNIPRDSRGGYENRRIHGDYRRDFVRPYDNRPLAQFSQGNRPPPPPRFRSNEARPVSPRRPSTDEFGRVVQDEDYERRPREEPPERRDRRYGRRYDDNDYRHDRRDYHDYRDRRGRDDRRHYDRDYSRYSDHAEYRRRRRQSHERRRRRSPSFSTSRSRSVSPSSSSSRSSSESRSRSRSRS